MTIPAVLEQKGMEFIKWLKERKEERLKARIEESTNLEFLKQLSLAKQGLASARENFNFATDEAMTDYYIYMIKAEETKLNYFISLAKKENIKNPHIFTQYADFCNERS
ncbi:MAG: DUF2508 family protein [Clostridia bacterium]|nr:DUF2508 family protein [Clostridia bacterium]